MPQEVLMPQMGESITEGTLVRWLKKPGDRVRRDEPLFEISTDKVDTEVPAPADGVLSEIRVKEGQTVPVNTVVCTMTGAGEAAAVRPAAAPAPAAAAPKSAPVPGPSTAPAQAPQPMAAKAGPAASGTDEEATVQRSSPLVRKIAQEQGVAITQIPGTGAGGRVTKKDILDFIAQREAAPQAALSAPAAGIAIPAAAGPFPSTAGHAAKGPASEDGGWDAAGLRTEPMSIMRAKIAEHMINSRRTSAHVTTVHEVDITEVGRAREARKESFLQETGVKLTFLPFILKATVDALKEFPILNASISGKDILYHRNIHLGIAVALDDGLIVPIIRSAEDRSILGLAKAVQDLADRARTKRLSPEEVQGGTFTVTNFGSNGTLFATPIINQPQVAILGIGAAAKRPVVLPKTDAIAVRTMIHLCLTYDHRLIDGAVADRYLLRVREMLEGGPFPLI